MSGGSLYLVDRCDVRRRGRNEQAYGGKATYQTHLTDVPCRLVKQEQRGVNSLTGEFLLTTTHKLMVLPDADILEGDRVESLMLRDGSADGDSYTVAGGSLRHRGRMASYRMLALTKIS